MTKTITDNHLGTIILTKKRGIKNLTLRLKADEVRVTLPATMSFAYALNFARSKEAWILEKKQLNKHRVQLLSNENPLSTLTFVLHLSPGMRNDYQMKLSQGVLTVFYPQATDPESDKVQQVFRQAICIALRREAKRVLPARLKALSEQHGFAYSAVKINASKGRWGSCSTQKNINLSFYLLRLPVKLIDYVLLHELCHTREMNHSPRFWAELDRVTGNRAKELAGQVKIFSRTLSEL